MIVVVEGFRSQLGLMSRTPVEPSGKARKCDKVRIFHEILASIMERVECGVARVTRIQNEVNLHSDRLLMLDRRAT
jgi:hypothetical protein